MKKRIRFTNGQAFTAQDIVILESGWLKAYFQSDQRTWQELYPPHVIERVQDLNDD